MIDRRGELTLCPFRSVFEADVQLKCISPVAKGSEVKKKKRLEITRAMGTKKNGLLLELVCLLHGDISHTVLAHVALSADSSSVHQALDLGQLLRSQGC